MPGFCDDPDTDPLGRELGEALWPERWPVSELTKQRKQLSLLMGGAVWNAQVQQRPNEAGGSVFPEAKWRFVKAHELPDDVTWCRGWDLAATEGGGDWTVGVRVGRLFDGRFVIGHVERGQWDGHTWRQKMRSAAAGDPDGTMVKLPQDPGQAGKDQAQQLIAHMAGFDASANPVTGNKEIRANSYAAQQQAGNVLIVEGEWNARFVSEHTDFPRGSHDDQVDAAATAFNALAEFGEPGIRWLT
jgi:predicted phage terminase large subunit-like protein